MDSKRALTKIKEYLEARGTTFSEYYGSWIYKSGPCPSEFFMYKNEGEYSVHLLRIPEEYFYSLITEKSLNSYLKSR